MADYNRGWIRTFWLQDGEYLDSQKRGGEERYAFIPVTFALVRQLAGEAKEPQELAEKFVPVFRQGTGISDLEVLGWEVDLSQVRFNFLVYAPSLDIVPDNVMVPAIECVFKTEKAT